MAHLFDQDKDYVEIEFQPDRLVSAEEINTLQKLVKDVVRDRTLGQLYEEGGVIEGLRPLRVAGDDTQLNITSGYIFLNGQIWDVPATTITGYSASINYEYVYANWQIERITPQVDTDLRDSTTGEDLSNYLRFVVTLDRIDKSGWPNTGSIIERNTSPIVVYQWDKNTGDIYPPQNVGIPGTSIASKFKLNQMAGKLDARRLEQLNKNIEFLLSLAERTYEESGNYVVEGFRIRPHKTWEKAAKVLFEVTSGVCYVKGHRIERSAETVLEADESAALAIEVADESHIMVGNVKGVYSKSYPLNKFVENNLYVDTITSVTGWGTAPGIAIERLAYIIGEEELVSTGGEIAENVVGLHSTIAEVTGAGVYTKGVNYTFKEDGATSYYVDWIDSVGSPSIGYQYICTYWQDTTFVDQDDYDLYGNGFINWFGGESVPVGESTFFVTYEYKQNRHDLVYVYPQGKLQRAGEGTRLGDFRIDGAIKVKKGIYADEPVVPEPPQDALAVGHVIVHPGNDHGARNYYNDRHTMQDIVQLSHRLSKLEGRVSRNNYVNLGRHYTASYGDYGAAEVVVDDTTVADTSYAYGTWVWSASMDFQEHIIYPGRDKFTPTNSPIYDYGVSSASISTYASYITINETSTSNFLVQDQWSSTISLDPLSAYDSEGPFLVAHPNLDVWFNTTAMTDTEQNACERAAKYKHYEITDIERDSYNYFRDMETKFGRGIETVVEGFGFSATELDISVWMDGAVLSIGTVSVGSKLTSTTLAATGSGYFKAYATVTSTPTGIIDDGGRQLIAVGEETNTASTVYGIMSHLDSRWEMKTSTYSSPKNAAQIFYNEDKRLLKSVKVGIESAPTSTTEDHLTVMLTGVYNNQPSGTILFQKTYTSADISESLPADVEFEFENPVYLEEEEYYAIVLITNSDDWVIQQAVVGENGRNPQELIISVPYSDGRFLVSENGLLWYPKEDRSLRFSLVSPSYQVDTDKVFEVDNITFGSSDITRFYFAPDVFLPDDTTITYHYSLDGGGHPGGTWHQFFPNQIVVLRNADGTEVSTDQLAIKLTMQTADSNISPILNCLNGGDDEPYRLFWRLQAWTHTNEIYYYSKAFELAAESAVIGGFTVVGEVKDHASVTIYYSTDDTTWSNVPTSQIIGYGGGNYVTDDGWSRVNWSKDSLTTGRIRFAVKVVGDGGLKPPKMRNFSFILTRE